LAIIAPSSFKNKSDIEYLENLFGKPNLFYLDDFEKNKMFSNGKIETSSVNVPLL
jgi:hypothetical protein